MASQAKRACADTIASTSNSLPTPSPEKKRKGSTPFNSDLSTPVRNVSSRTLTNYVDVEHSPAARNDNRIDDDGDHFLNVSGADSPMNHYSQKTLDEISSSLGEAFVTDLMVENELEQQQVIHEKLARQFSYAPIFEQCNLLHIVAGVLSSRAHANFQLINEIEARHRLELSSLRLQIQQLQARVDELDSTSQRNNNASLGGLGRGSDSSVDASEAGPRVGRDSNSAVGALEAGPSIIGTADHTISQPHNNASEGDRGRDSNSAVGASEAQSPSVTLKDYLKEHSYHVAAAALFVPFIPSGPRTLLEVCCNATQDFLNLDGGSLCVSDVSQARDILKKAIPVKRAELSRWLISLRDEPVDEVLQKIWSRSVGLVERTALNQLWLTALIVYVRFNYTNNDLINRFTHWVGKNWPSFEEIEYEMRDLTSGEEVARYTRSLVREIAAVSYTLEPCALISASDLTNEPPTIPQLLQQHANRLMRNV